MRWRWRDQPGRDGAELAPSSCCSRRQGPADQLTWGHLGPLMLAVGCPSAARPSLTASPVPARHTAHTTAPGRFCALELLGRSWWPWGQLPVAPSRSTRVPPQPGLCDPAPGPAEWQRAPPSPKSHQCLPRSSSPGSPAKPPSVVAAFRALVQGQGRVGAGSPPTGSLPPPSACVRDPAARPVPAAVQLAPLTPEILSLAKQPCIKSRIQGWK